MKCLSYSFVRTSQVQYTSCVFMNKFHVTYGGHCAVSICIKLTSSLTKELAVYYGQFSRGEDLVT